MADDQISRQHERHQGSYGWEGTITAQSDLQPLPLMDMDFVVICQLVWHRMPQIRFLFIGFAHYFGDISNPVTNEIFRNPRGREEPQADGRRQPTGLYSGRLKPMQETSDSGENQRCARTSTTPRSLQSRNNPCTGSFSQPAKFRPAREARFQTCPIGTGWYGRDRRFRLPVRSELP